MSDYIQIGKIINTHGIKGYVKVVPLTDDKMRFNDLEKVIIEGEKEEFEIEKVWYKKNQVMVKFKGYDNINDVTKYRDKYLLIDKSDAIELPEDTFFIYDIIGLTVYTLDGEEVGSVKQVLQPGSNDVYVVERVEKTGKDILIPAIRDVVKEVNVEEGKIVIDPIEGLIE